LDSFKPLSSFTAEQGDHIGRFLGYWAIVYFGQFTERALNFSLLVSTVKVIHQF
jgi:hypothetical protein